MGLRPCSADPVRTTGCSGTGPRRTPEERTRVRLASPRSTRLAFKVLSECPEGRRKRHSRRLGVRDVSHARHPVGTLDNPLCLHESRHGSCVNVRWFHKHVIIRTFIFGDANGRGQIGLCVGSRNRLRGLNMGGVDQYPRVLSCVSDREDVFTGLLVRMCVCGVGKRV